MCCGNVLSHCLSSSFYFCLLTVVGFLDLFNSLVQVYSKDVMMRKDLYSQTLWIVIRTFLTVFLWYAAMWERYRSICKKEAG